MINDRFVRWQGYAIEQLTFVLNLFFGISVGSLVFAISLARDKEFSLSGCPKLAFQVGVVSLCLAIILSCGAVVSRLLDFRITAKKIRADTQEDKEESGVFKYKSMWLGKLTWRLFWLQLVAVIIGLIGLVISVISVYGERFW